MIQLFYERISFRVMATGAAIAVFVYPLAFKFWVLPEYVNLKRFYEKAHVLNLPYHLIFKEVIQSYLTWAYLNSLLYICLFAAGDFIMGEIIMGETKTLGMAIRSYIQTYRLPEAQVLSLILVGFAGIGGGLSFLFRGNQRGHS